MSTSWIQKLLTGSNAKQSARKSKSFYRPLLEFLEDRTLPATIINSTFNTLPDNVELKGTAFADPGFVTLTLSKTDGRHQDGNGSLLVDSTGSAITSFLADTTLTIHSENATGLHTHGVGADGISFGYGPLSGNAFGEEGERENGGLWVSIDTFPNNDTVGISAWYSNRLLFEVQMDHNAPLYGGFKHLIVDMNTTGTLSVTHPALDTPNDPNDSATRVVHVQGWNPQPTWRFGVGARTGAASAWHVIEDMKIVDRTETGDPTPQTINVATGEVVSYEVPVKAKEIFKTGDGTAVFEQGFETDGTVTVQSGTTIVSDGTTSKAGSIKVEGGGSIEINSSTLEIGESVLVDFGGEFTVQNDDANFSMQGGEVNGNMNFSSGAGTVLLDVESGGWTAGPSTKTSGQSNAITAKDVVMTAADEPAIIGIANSTTTLAFGLTGNSSITASEVRAQYATELFLDSNSSINAPLTISDGAKLRGKGRVNGSLFVGTQSTSDTATLSPGQSPGKLTTGSLTMNAGAILEIELDGNTAGVTYDQVVGLYPLFPLLDPLGWQAFTSFPMVKPSLFIAPQDTVHATTEALGMVGLQLAVQHGRQQHGQLGNGQSRCLFFFPACSPALKTNPLTAPNTDGDANHANSAPGSPPALPRSWHAGNTPRCDTPL